jgi:hypothetical protein
LECSTTIIGFYRVAASHLQPLHAALKGKSASSSPRWSDITTGAFEKAKSHFTEPALLAHPLHDARLALSTDASDLGFGAALEQWNNGVWQPIAFFSRHLLQPQQAYSVINRELLGAYLVVRHFHSA